MTIDRHNYEEYFILYMDNELGMDARRKVEEFVQKNPDLKEELDNLMQFKLVPDSSIVFENKSQLIKQDDVASPVNLANYEEWLMMYVDDELNAGEKEAVDDFISSHPAVKKELAVLLQTKLQPEPVLFANKESLYRSERKVRVMPVRWWRVAAAAVLFIAAGTVAVISINNKKTGSAEKEIAKTPANPEKIKKESPVINNNKTEDKPATQQVMANNTAEVISPAVNKTTTANKTVTANTNNETVVKNNPVEKKQSAVLDEVIKTQQQVIANNDNKQTPSNNLPRPLNNPNIEKISTDIAAANSANKAKQDVKADNIVTTIPTETSDIKYASNVELEQPGGKKNSKLRGLLRKVTRTFEKTTNIDATDDEDRVLIGGLALKLK